MITWPPDDADPTDQYPVPTYAQVVAAASDYFDAPSGIHRPSALAALELYMLGAGSRPNYSDFLPPPTIPAECPDGSTSGAREISFTIEIEGLDGRTMYENDCVVATVNLPGDLEFGVNYVVHLSTSQGLAFDEDCTNFRGTWGFVGHSTHSKEYAIQACPGFTRGTMNVSLKRGPTSVSGARASVTVRPRPAPTPTSIPTPTNTPAPTDTPLPPRPTPTPSVLCANLDAARDTGRASTDFEIRTDAAMSPGDCVEASVMIPRQGFGVRVEITAAYGLSFNRQCDDQDWPGVVLSGQVPHTFPVPIVACDDARNYGILTAEVKKEGSTVGTPVSAYVLVIEDTSLVGTEHGSWNNGKNLCVITKRLSREDNDTHFQNGENEAHYVRSTIYGGRTATITFLKTGKFLAPWGIFGGTAFDYAVDRSDGDCIVGYVESTSSHHRTSTLDATLKKLPSGGTITSTNDNCTGTGICDKKVGIFVIPDSQSGGRFSLEGTHKVSENGSEIVNLSATAYYDRP